MQNTRRWFEVPDLVGYTTYDTPTGQPAEAGWGCERLDLPIDEAIADQLLEHYGETYSAQPYMEALAIARTLPADTYLSQEMVMAILTAAIQWGKPVHVSWMQMDYDPFAGEDVPIQHHRKQAAVMYVDDCLWKFGVSAGDDPDLAHIAMDCVTDMRLVLFPSTPTEQLPVGLQTDG